jgi:ATP-dependent Clp protease ATP-binding subunit ClpC
MKEAKSFDDVKVRPEHLVLSILLDDDNECVRVLKKLNIDTTDLYDRISDSLRKDVSIPRINNVTTKKTLPFSDETKAIIKALDYECEKLNDNMIDTTHIMLAILLTKSPTTEILKDLNVNYTNFKKTMKEINGNLRNSAFDGGGEENDEQESFKRRQKQGEAKSKTPVLDNFCRNISKAAELGELDPLVGRQVEIKRVSQILSRRRKNNPILVGVAGSGKCICADTEIVMRNDATGETFKTTVSEFLNTLPKA